MDRCHALEGVENNMKTMILASLLLSGCAINVPPEYNSPAVDVVCAAKDGETVAWIDYEGRKYRYNTRFLEFEGFTCAFVTT